jgi:hypothetical protein
VEGSRGRGVLEDFQRALRVHRCGLGAGSIDPSRDGPTGSRFEAGTDAGATEGEADETVG